jgi:hypothetical protein
MKYPSLGSVSSGTLRPQDLIPEFAAALAAVLTDNENDADIELSNPANRWLESLEALTNDLNQFAPPFTYFGSAEGDGADFGFWLDHDGLEEAVHDGEVIQIPAGAGWPEPGDWDYILEVSDHGNMTLFNSAHNEIWSII